MKNELRRVKMVFPRHPSPAKARGMTLLELTVVLLILLALAGLVVPYTSGISQQAQCDATDASMVAIRNAIMGGGAVPGFYADTLGKLPRSKEGGSAYLYKLRYLFEMDSELSTYNPKTKTGWNGPYLMNGATAATPTGLHDSFLSSTENNTSAPYKYTDPVLSDDQVVLDGWGRPIILQVPNPSDLSSARLVSAGPGVGWGTDEARLDTTIANTTASDRGDDRVLFLKIPDPGSNASCK